LLLGIIYWPRLLLSINFLAANKLLAIYYLILETKSFSIVNFLSG